MRCKARGLTHSRLIAYLINYRTIPGIFELFVELLTKLEGVVSDFEREKRKSEYMAPYLLFHAALSRAAPTLSITHHFSLVRIETSLTSTIAATTNLQCEALLYDALDGATAGDSAALP